MFSETPYSNLAQEVLRLLKIKAPDADLQVPLSTIQENASELGVTDPLVASTDCFLTAVCYLGSKSLSHVLSQIERYKERLLSIGAASETARRQIITSVMEYWAEKPGVGVNVVDKLLNYTILTPQSVVLWALSDQLGRGEGLVLAHVYEMVASTVTKVTGRVEQIVMARNAPDLPSEQFAVLDETLSQERDEMGKLFALIEDALMGIAAGSNDVMAEGADQDERGEATLRGWGARWLRVFKRKMAVQEAWLIEIIAQNKAARERMNDMDATIDVAEDINGQAFGEK